MSHIELHNLINPPKNIDLTKLVLGIGSDYLLAIYNNLPKKTEIDFKFDSFCVSQITGLLKERLRIENECKEGWWDNSEKAVNIRIEENTKDNKIMILRFMTVLQKINKFDKILGKLSKEESFLLKKIIKENLNLFISANTWIDTNWEYSLDGYTEKEKLYLIRLDKK